MSALDAKVDICRVGQWTGMDGKRVDVTPDLLDRIVENFRHGDPVPIVCGHPKTDSPAYGLVDTLERVGDRLQATFKKINPAFRAAVEGGQFSGRSISFSPDGRLRHVGFLGGTPPAVPGLAPSHFSGGDDFETVELAVDKDGALAAAPQWQVNAFRAMAQLARSMRAMKAETMGEDAANQAFPMHHIEALEKAAQDAEGGGEMAGSTGEPPTAREAALAAREAAVTLAEATGRARDWLKPHVDAGRVLPAECARLEALAARLDGGNVIQFAANGETVEETPLKALDALLAALPVRVDYREDMAGGPIPPLDPGGNAAARQDRMEAVAHKAQTLMKTALAKGDRLTLTDAIALAEKETDT